MLHLPLHVQVLVLPQRMLHSYTQPTGPIGRRRPGLKAAGARQNSAAFSRWLRRSGQ